MPALIRRPRLAVFARDTRAAEVVEFALVLPILLFLLAGIIDMGFLFNNYQTITNAAREGARVAVVAGFDAATLNDRVTERVKQYVAADGMNPAAVGATATPVQIDVPGGSINAVRVVVTYPYNYMVLGPIAQLVQADQTFDTVTLTAAATMRTEMAAGL